MGWCQLSKRDVCTWIMSPLQYFVCTLGLIVRGIRILSHDQKNNPYRNGVCENVWILHGCLDVSYRSWDKTKNPWRCWNCTFPNSVHHQNHAVTWPVTSCLPGPDDAPQWETCNFHMGVGFCYNLVHHSRWISQVTHEPDMEHINLLDNTEW